MSNSHNSTGQLRLLCSASLIALAVACLADTSIAAGNSGKTASAPSKAAPAASKQPVATAETQVAQNTPAPPPPPAPPAPPTAEQPANVEKVTVTGFRSSLRNALNEKRKSNSQIDSIKAEDIGKFPDLNLSESIQRVPGVSITRDAGEGRQISVRGLGPQFTRIRINGMEALSTAGGTDAAGGTNRGRSFDFNVFAADLFNSITVRKTPSAEIEEGSLGATIDLRAPRPLDFDGFKFTASGQYGWNDLSDTYDPRGAALVSWSDGEFGALFSIAYAERNLMEAGASTVRWQNNGANPPGSGTANAGAANAGFGSETVAAYTLAQLNAAFHPRIPRYDIYEHEQERLGMTGSLQWRPTDRTTLSLDLLYSKLDGKRNEIFLEAPSFSANGTAGIQGSSVVDAVIQGDNLVYGVFNGVDIRSEFRNDELSTEFSQGTFEAEHYFSDAFKIHAIAGHAKSDHQNPIQTTLLFDANNINGYSYDYRQNPDLPVIKYGTTDVTNPATWTLSQIRLRPQTAINTYTTYQGDTSYDVLDWLTLKVGADWKEYEFETTEKRRATDDFTTTTLPNCLGAPPANNTLQRNGNVEACLPAFVVSTPLSSYSRLVTFSDDGLDVPLGNTVAWLVPDIDKAVSLWDLYNESKFKLSPDPAIGNNATIKEEDTGGFFQADFEIPNTFFRGNIGVRYVETKQTAIGKSIVAQPTVQPILGTLHGGILETSIVERTYTDTLPSFNLVAEPVENFLIRLGMSKVMTRPGLGSLIPSAVLSGSSTIRTVTVGNPNLDPFRAENFDLAFEWYPRPQALVGFALFRKNITSFSFTQRQDMVYHNNPLGLSDALAIAACGGAAGCDPNALWTFNIPVNTNGGEVTGFEFNFQLPLTFLPSPLDNLGVLANYTYVASDIDYINTDGSVATTADLLNLSRNAYNATLYYEDDTWSARVSAAFRSKYLTTIPGRNNNISESTAGTLNIDFAGAYTINENFKITLEGLNLTDEVNDQYLDPQDRSSFYHNFGRQYFLGVRYTY